MSDPPAPDLAALRARIAELERDRAHWVDAAAQYCQERDRATEQLRSVTQQRDHAHDTLAELQHERDQVQAVNAALRAALEYIATTKEPHWPPDVARAALAEAQ